jgi:hypothetical protein
MIMNDFDFYRSVVKHLTTINSSSSDLALVLKEAELRLDKVKPKSQQGKKDLSDWERRVAANKKALSDLTFGIGMDHRDPFGSW